QQAQEPMQTNNPQSNNNTNGAPQNQSNNNTNGAPQLHFFITIMPGAPGTPGTPGAAEGNNQPPTPFMFFFTPFFFPPQEAHHPHVSDAAMKKLPIITITQEHIDTKATCPICLEQLQLTEIIKGQNQKPIRQMPCKHIFCESCLFTWLKQNNTCPLCRYEIKDDLQSQPTPDIPQNDNNTQNDNMNDSTTDSSESTNSHHPNNSHTFTSCELAHVGCCGEDSHSHNPIISLSRCRHKFHASCLRTSLTIEGYSIDSSSSSSLEFFCPTCRAPSILQSDMLKILENNSVCQNDSPPPTLTFDEMDLD
ncbi:10237_t:CDS:1, partial [Gigaspora rosea]